MKQGCIVCFIKSELSEKILKQKRKECMNATLFLILDFEEFKTEYENYEKFLKENRKRKRKHNLGWSVSAIECFQRNMKCSKCACEKICKRIADKTPDKIPPMKKTIQKLLSELGLPPKL